MRPATEDTEDHALRITLTSIGCKLNAYETEALAWTLQQQGHRLVEPHAEADVCVVNTCTVTSAGDADSRKAIRRARRRNPGATVVVTGCYAQHDAAAVTAAGADLVVGNADKARLPEILQAYRAGRLGPPPPTLPPPRTSRFLELSGALIGGRTRGSLQIQDGCDARCTYCAVPAVRGPGVSRNAAEIVDQARRMVDAGYHELALTGVNIGSYGHDRQQPQALIELLCRLETIEGLERIRLSSLEPAFLSDLLIDYAARSSRLCRHFHVPLQSGDEMILKRMGRHYTRTFYAERIQQLAAAVPDCAIGADVMVGFPGETEARFQRTFDLLAELPLTYLHVFAYSRRPGTPAARMPDHPSQAAKKARSRALIEWGQARRHAFHQHHLGATLDVLLEDRADAGTGLQTGLSDNYIKVLVSAPGMANRIVPVRITAANGASTRGILVE